MNVYGQIGTGKQMLRGWTGVAVLCFVLVAALSASPAGAEEVAKKDGWRFGLDNYVWMPSLTTTMANGSETEIKFEDLFKNLNFTFMGVFHARKGRWHASADVMYMDLGADTSTRLSTDAGPGIKVDAEVGMKSWTVTPALGYVVLDTPRVSLETFAGARYFYTKMDLDLNIIGPLGKSESDSAHVWDGIVGIRGNVNLADDWYLPYGVDVGTGDSDLTWQALAGVAYRIKPGMDVVAAYRHLVWEFKEGSPIDSMAISGPMVGLRLIF
jgi:opacity protein-like surface antigen